MFDKKDDNSNSTPDAYRPAKGSAKVVIGHGVTINGETIYQQAQEEINKLEEQIQLAYELPPEIMVG